MPNDTIIDHRTWIWRADHGSGVGWMSSLKSDNGTVWSWTATT